MKFILFVLMCYAHLFDDYYLQGILASMKQKSWWEKNAPEEMYKNDYKIALFEHAFSWSISIFIPLIAYSLIKNVDVEQFSIFASIGISLNTVIHAWIDNMKANKHKINLITDQLFHFVQIAITQQFFASLFM